MAALTFSLNNNEILAKEVMENNSQYDVIIIGGSFSGLAAGMALGRALRKVLIIDGGEPCNRQTPYSHNFLTQDGKTPKEISTLAKNQVLEYRTVKFENGLAVSAKKSTTGFDVQMDNGVNFSSKKIILATGIKDIMPNISGIAECWGISVIHCPYCHGYEVKGAKTGILGNGEYGFEFSKLISNWTDNLTLFTNGVSSLTKEQTGLLKFKGININENLIDSLEHKNGKIQNIIFKNQSEINIDVIYIKNPFEQSSTISQKLGCELTEEGYLKIDFSQKTTIKGIYACGDNVSRMRTVANAVSMGTTAGMMLNKELIEDEFMISK